MPGRCKDGEPVTIGQAEIEDGGIIIDQLERGTGVGRRGGNVDRKAASAELRFQDALEARFIFDDQYTHALSPLTRRCLVESTA
jgi:hypothetical protein